MRRNIHGSPTFGTWNATNTSVQNSKAFGLRDRLESKVAESPKAETLAGDIQFEELIRTYGPELRRFVFLKVEPGAVDDVLQDVWVAAWQSFSTVQARTAIRAWIYGICLHKCHDHYRHRAKEVPKVAMVDLELFDPRPSPEGLAIDAARVTELLSHLDVAQREVVELYYYAQLTLAEISELLDRNMNTVKYQFYRAHTTLLEVGRREELL